tara:strand:+ start:731 stop:937 length:207 start_codon:yes stop_codon:yes gene_type:complete
MNNKYKAGDLVKRRKYSYSRFEKNSKESYEIGVVVEFESAKKMSGVSRALVLINSKIVDTSIFFLEKI